MQRWPTIVLHADMDAFYAAVEQLDNPELRGKPVLVGPQGNRGVVLTASYEARPFGVGSAMPVAEARRRCPGAVTVTPRFSRYKAISQQVMDIFKDFSPKVEAISLDEAFLDMSGAEHFFGPPAEMGARLKAAVYAATGLHISVGVASTKYVAKVASSHDKPNGLTVVRPHEVRDWLAPLPVRRLWGVGPVTGAKLERLGLHLIGDIAAAEPAWLDEVLGSTGTHFHQLANGIDVRRVQRGRSVSSLGSDRTLSTDVYRRADIELHLRRAADRLARRIRAKEYVAHGLRIRLKTTQFEMLTRQRKFRHPSDTASEFFSLACLLLDDLRHAGPFRLVGMAVFDLDWHSQPRQQDMFVQPDQHRLEVTIDDLIERFGSDTVFRASDLAGLGTITKNGVNLDFLDYEDGERMTSPRTL